VIEVVGEVIAFLVASVALGRGIALALDALLNRKRRSWSRRYFARRVTEADRAHADEARLLAARDADRHRGSAYRKGGAPPA
jgi:hypothetical protein